MYTDRLRQAAYTTPDGLRLSFDYEDVSVDIEAKGTAFEFAGGKTYVQRKTCTMQRFPMNVIIAGVDYDRKAKAFMDNLTKFPGGKAGKLDHPLYGVFDVLPLGGITRTDRLKSAGGQAVIRVTFYETTAFEFSEPDLFGKINGFIDQVERLITDTFVNNIYVSKITESVAMTDYVIKRAGAFGSDLTSMFGITDQIKQSISTIDNSIKSSVNNFIPSVVSHQTFKMQKIAASQKTQPEYNRVNSLTEIAKKNASVIFKKEPGNHNGENNYQYSNQLASQTMALSALAAMNVEYENRDQAVNAAVTLMDSLLVVMDWQDKNISSLGIIDTGESYQAMVEIVSITAGFLINNSANLPTGKTLFIDRNRTIIDVAAEVYGDISDETLNKIINNNNLSADEILMLSYGDNIIYYG